MRVVAVIPVYNEGERIAEVVRKTLEHVDEVVVVNDGSSDRSAEFAERAGARVISLPRNTGKANALRQGFSATGDCDVVVTLDGDLQHLPEEIPVLLGGIERGCDLVIGSRFLSGKLNMPPQRRLSNLITSGIISLLTRRRITDPQSGFRAIRASKLKLLSLKAERYAIEHIMILEAVRKGLKVCEVPVSAVYGGEKSHIRPLRDTLSVAYYILRFVVGGR
ncbi:MAG: glycosyltransferase family 2 protein [Euryarchaeota archaeon]|nr:glycosyltransferase family 2 protein [Euryarchaeota archaeon]